MATKQPIFKLSANIVSNLRFALIISIFPASQLGAAEAISDAAVNAQQTSNAAVATSQEAINGLVDQTQQLSTQYAQALAELDSFNQYNGKLQEQISAQQTEIASIQTQLIEIETTNREVLPLMERMVATLDQFIAADVPFLIDERVTRVRNLQELMGRSDVAISEKYRRILEAYQIELEFGRTLEAYNGMLGEGAQARTVQFVRLGRISLMYQTLDGTETGYYDAQAKAWVEDESYTESVIAALAVARQEGAPDLLRVPVPAPQGVR
ncbi:MAG: DUF3450 domain-containing protein [Pseudohongiellaceae bacterium]|jgi:seryl-tRNA synthetase